MRASTVVLVLAAFFCIVNAATRNSAVNITGDVTKIGVGQLLGPESIAADSQGFIYASVNDGSIRKIDPVTLVSSVYAYTNPTLADRTACGTPAAEATCGRALGIKFDSKDNLYVADAVFGLLKIPRDNVANVQVLATQSNGVPLRFTNALVINKAEDTIYFTDTSSTTPRTQFVRVLLENKPEGRLIKYNIATGTTTTLITGLEFGNGIAFNDDESSLLINETGKKRVSRLRLKGSRAGQFDVIVDNLECYPDNIEHDEVTGNFLVGCYSFEAETIDFLIDHPDLSALAVQYIPPVNVLSLISTRGVIKVINDSGRILKTLLDITGTGIARIAEAKRVGEYVYIGSVLNPFLARVPASVLNERETYY